MNTLGELGMKTSSQKFAFLETSMNGSLSDLKRHTFRARALEYKLRFLASFSLHLIYLERG